MALANPRCSLGFTSPLCSAHGVVSNEKQPFTFPVVSGTVTDAWTSIQKASKAEGCCLSSFKGISTDVEVEEDPFHGRGQITSSAGFSSEVLQRLCEEAQLDRALEALVIMDQHDTVPSGNMYGFLLRACAKRKALSQAKQVQAHIAKRGLECSRFLGENVVSTLVKCGGLEDALQMFHRLRQKTVFSWTAVISGYTARGRFQEALRMYQWMKEEGVQPNAYTFVSLIKCCGSTVNLEEGKRIHAEAAQHKLETDTFVGNCLVNMYGKCGSVVDARNVFDRLSRRDVVSWNALIGAYAQQGRAEIALELYQQMWVEGVSPDARTFVNALQACGMVAEKEGAVGADGQLTRLMSLEQGKEIHADVWRKGYVADVYVANTLVSMYGKCGSITDAQYVFDRLSRRDVVSWNAMLAGYAQQGQSETALQVYNQMWIEGVSPDTWTFVRALQACGMLAEKEDRVVPDRQEFKLKCVEHGKALHADAWMKGCHSDSFVGNTLVSMYGKCGSIVDAKFVFDSLYAPDSVAWTAMITAYVEQGQAQEALHLYELMRGEGVSPTDRTFVSMLQACGMLAEDEEGVLLNGLLTKVKSLEAGRAMHADVHIQACYLDVFIGSTLIRMYGKCGSIADAQETFDGLLERNVVSWNAMLATYVEQGQGEKALQLYNKMQQAGASPDDITIVWVMQASSNTGSLGMLRHMHCNLEKRLNSFLASTLISAYGRCASMKDAQDLFDTLLKADVVCWNALIASYARQGDCAACLYHYCRMQRAGVHPNGITFLSLLSACSHAGLVEKCVEYFHSMSRDYGITPEIVHYVSLVDLLGRAGCFREIEDLLSKMPMQPSLEMWLCLLGACQKHGEVMLARHAFDCAVRLQPRHAAPYVLMSNIYADAGLWDQATEIKELRQSAGARKKPGQSWIQHKQEVHTFLVGDAQIFQQERQLYDLLEKFG